jgi:hypothetical protein
MKPKLLLATALIIDCCHILVVIEAMRLQKFSTGSWPRSSLRLQLTIRRYRASPICDVVVVVRDQEMVIRCPSYSQAVKWARLECKSYKIPEPDIDFPDDNQETDDVPLFLRSDKNWSLLGRRNMPPDAVDMRNLAQMLAHVHDAEIEIGEGPEPPARERPLQWTMDWSP